MSSCLDEIPCRVDQEQAELSAPALASHDDGGVRRCALRLDLGAIALLDLAHRFTHQLGCAIERVAGHDALDFRVDLGALHRRPDVRHHALRDAEIARAHQGHDALARLLEHEHLAEARDVVDARIGARVRQQHEARLELEANAISHVPPDLRPVPANIRPHYCWVCPS